MGVSCVNLVVVHEMLYLISEQPHQSLINLLRPMLQVGALVPEGKHWLPFLTCHCWKL